MEQQRQPPPMAVTQQAYTTNTGHGSVGPVIAVLAVITVLGVIAGLIGRLCSGGRIMGHGKRYELESWLETKCSSCIDGRINPHHPPPAPPPPPPPPQATITGEDATPEETSQEIKEEEHQQQQH